MSSLKCVNRSEKKFKTSLLFKMISAYLLKESPDIYIYM